MYSLICATYMYVYIYIYNILQVSCYDETIWGVLDHTHIIAALCTVFVVNQYPSYIVLKLFKPSSLQLIITTYVLNNR